MTGENPAVIELGETYTFGVEPERFGLAGDELEVTVEIEDEWADLLSRTVFTAEVVECRVTGAEGEGAELSGRLDDRWMLVEELEHEYPRGLEELPSEGFSSLRRPLGGRTVEDSTVLLYRNDAGVSLAELSALADGELGVRQVADIFSAVLEGVSQLHSAGILHLYLNPDLIRVRVADTHVGVPLADMRDEVSEASDLAETSSLGEEDTSVETPEAETEPEPDSQQDQRESSWGSSRYDETKPQMPLRVKMSEIDSDELPSIAEESSSLGEETTGVNEEGMSGNNWIREFGISPESHENRGEESEEGRGASAEVGRESTGTLPSEREGLELEVVFDAISGLYSVDEIPGEVEIVPGFSAPEAYSRGGAALEEASDIFSLGMVLYYLISGRIPPASVYTRHAPAIPERNFRPDFPPGLGPVVKRATRPDAEMRYPDAEALRAGFESALEAIDDRTPSNREVMPGMTVAVDRHTGIAKRQRSPVNQDNVFKGTSEDGQFGLIVVADGVSTASYGSGEIASRLLIEAAEEAWNDVLPAYLMEETIDEGVIVGNILVDGNERIIEYVNERHTPFSGSAHEVMGTTGLVALYHRGQITLAAVGDSRGYLQRGPGLEQLTIDHNLWTLSILQGLPADEALSMPRGDALARCLGTFEMDDGYLEPKPPGFDIFQFPVSRGDTLLLTTDGLVDFAGANVISSEENILATLLAEPDPALACLELILLANRGGGGDNIGVSVAKFE